MSSQDLAYSAAVASFSVGYFVFCLALVVVTLVGMWKVFEKAGKPGWACIVPFYNLYCLCDMAMGKGWLFLLIFVPCANLIIMIMMYFKLVQAFGKGVGFFIGMLFFPYVFMMILGFSNAEYYGPQ